MRTINKRRMIRESEEHIQNAIDDMAYELATQFFNKASNEYKDILFSGKRDMPKDSVDVVLEKEASFFTGDEALLQILGNQTLYAYCYIPAEAFDMKKDFDVMEELHLEDYKAENVKFTKSEIEKHFKKWLAQYLDKKFNIFDAYQKDGYINPKELDGYIQNLSSIAAEKIEDWFIGYDFENYEEDHLAEYGVNLASIVFKDQKYYPEAFGLFLEDNDLEFLQVGLFESGNGFISLGDRDAQETWIAEDNITNFQEDVAKLLDKKLMDKGIYNIFLPESKQKRKQVRENRLNKRRIGRRLLKESSEFDITPYIKKIVEEKAKKDGKTVEELEKSRFRFDFTYSINLKPYFKTLKKIKIAFFHSYDDTEGGAYNIDIMWLDILIWGSKPTKLTRVSSEPQNRDFFGFKTIEEMCKYMNQLFVEDDEYFDNLIKSRSINSNRTIKESSMIRRRARRLTEGRRVLPTKRTIIKESAKPAISKEQAEELAQSLVQGVMLDASRTSYDSNLLVKANTSANGVLFESKAVYNKDNGSFSNVKVLVNGVEKSLLGSYKGSEISELTKNLSKHLQNSALLSESKSTCIRSKRMVVESKALYNELLKAFKASKSERIHDDYDPEDEEHDIEDWRMTEYEASLHNMKGLKKISDGYVIITEMGGVYSITSFRWTPIMGDISYESDVYFDGRYGSFESAVQAVYKEIMSIENANKRR